MAMSYGTSEHAKEFFGWGKQLRSATDVRLAIAFKPFIDSASKGMRGKDTGVKRSCSFHFDRPGTESHELVTSHLQQQEHCSNIL